MAQSLYLLDGFAHLYAAYFAIGRRLTSPAGEPTNAVYGVVRLLLKLLRDRRPDRWAVVLDPPGPVFRNELDADYKAHRKPMPDDLVPQPALLRKVLAAMEIPVFCVDGFEADDVMGTLARRASAAGMDVYLCSKDKDLGQLLTDPAVRIYDTRTDAVIDAARWTEEWGVRPDQVVDYLALVGDASDNVPGAKGIGDKTAAKLLAEYGTLDALLASTGKLKGKQRENLEAYIPQAPLSRKLVTLVCDVPLEVEFDRLAARAPDPAKAEPVFRELGFASLLGEAGIKSAPGASGAATAKPAAPVVPQVTTGDSSAPAAVPAVTVTPGTPFARLVAELADVPPLVLGVLPDDAAPDLPRRVVPQLPAGKGAFHVVDTAEALTKLAADLAAQPCFAMDTETTGLDSMEAELVGLSFAWREGEGWYVPVKGTMLDRVLPWSEVSAALRPVLENPAIGKTGQHLKYDIVVLRNHGIRVAGVSFDSLVAAFCLDPARREFGIDALCRDLFGFTKIPTAELLGKGKKALRMDEVPVPKVAEYAAEDADFAWRLRGRLGPELAPAGVGKLFAEVELPLVGVLADMEEAGIAVDAKFLGGMSGEMEAELASLRGKIIEAAGVEFNPDSPKQLGEVLFGKLGLKSGRKTAGGAAATDQDVLEQLAEEHPLPGLVLQHRQITKLKGTYVDALPKLINKRTGRVHAKFHQSGAQTGRLSSSDPNLQNIPIRTELGRRIRQAFTAGRPGSVLLTADYSQIELRLLAHFSGDDALCEAFRGDRDIHRFVAAQVAGIPEDQVTSEMRYKAKAVNFGIIYGQGAYGLARSTGMTPAEAKNFIGDYFGRYPKVQAFIDDCIRFGSAAGYAPTVMGRKRRIEVIRSNNRGLRSFGERLAVNTVLQGSAADLIKIAMVNIARRIAREGRPSRMLMTIHDELVFEVPEESVKDEAAMIAAEMSSALTLGVPLKVDTAWGRNWQEAG